MSWPAFASLEEQIGARDSAHDRALAQYGSQVGCTAKWTVHTKCRCGEQPRTLTAFHDVLRQAMKADACRHRCHFEPYAGFAVGWMERAEFEPDAARRSFAMAQSPVGMWLIGI
jgi:hypothetical protein